jgi:membrane-associated protease RseP (regulator of RpoE activity)
VKDPLEEASEEVTRKGAVTTALLVLAGIVVLAVVRPSTIDTFAIIFGIVFMVMFHEAGHYLAAKRSGMKVTEYFLGFGPRIWSFRRGETEYGIKAIPAGGYVRIIGMNNLEEVDPEDEPRTYRQAKFHRRLIVVLAGVTANILLAGILFFVAFAAQGMYDGPSTTLRLVEPGTPAAAAGLEPGDRMLAIDGQPVESWDGATELIEGRAGETSTFLIERDGQQLTLDVTPVACNETSLCSRSDDNGFIGVSPGAQYENLGVFGAARESVQTLGRGTVAIGEGLAHLFSPSGVGEYGQNFTGDAPTASSPAAEERPRSIIGIVNVGDDIVDGDIWALLELLAVINLALAIFNLIPLLPFDGGHAAIAVYEKVASTIKRREVRVDYRKLVPVTAVVLALFFTLALSTAYLDIREIFGGS